MTDHDHLAAVPDPSAEPDLPEEFWPRIFEVVPREILDDESLWTPEDDAIVTDPIVSEIVRREVRRDSVVKHHLPQGFDDMPLDQRRRLYAAVENALVPAPDMGWVEGAEFLEPTKDPEWLITDLITKSSEGGRVLVAGPEKSFKSLFAVGCMVAVASGEPLFNYEPWSVPTAGRVLAFMGEGGREFNRTRVSRLMEGYGFDMEKKLETVNRLKMATVPLTPPERFVLKLEEDLKESDWDLVIVDSLYVFGGDTERSQLSQMGTLLVNWAEVCERAGTTLLVVDHFRKSETSLELQSVSGVGASQWAQAWSLMTAKYGAEDDKATLTVKTGARQSMGGVHRVVITGVMHGAMLSRVEKLAESDVTGDEIEALEKERSKMDALINFNLECHASGWMTRSEIRRLAKSDEAYDFILSQSHVAIAQSKSGKMLWAFAAAPDATVPPPPPKSELTRPPEFNKGEGDDDTAEGDTEE